MVEVSAIISLALWAVAGIFALAGALCIAVISWPHKGPKT